MPTWQGKGHDRSEGEWSSRVTETRALGRRKMTEDPRYPEDFKDRTRA